MSQRYVHPTPERLEDAFAPNATLNWSRAVGRKLGTTKKAGFSVRPNLLGISGPEGVRTPDLMTASGTGTKNQRHSYGCSNMYKPVLTGVSACLLTCRDMPSNRKVPTKSPTRTPGYPLARSPAIASATGG